MTDQHAEARDRAALRWMRLNDHLGWGTTPHGRRSNRTRYGRNAKQQARDKTRARAFRAVRA